MIEVLRGWCNCTAAVDRQSMPQYNRHVLLSKLPLFRVLVVATNDLLAGQELSLVTDSIGDAGILMLHIDTFRIIQVGYKPLKITTNRPDRGL